VYEDKVPLGEYVVRLVTPWGSLASLSPEIRDNAKGAVSVAVLGNDDFAVVYQVPGREGYIAADMYTSGGKLITKTSGAVMAKNWTGGTVYAPSVTARGPVLAVAWSWGRKYYKPWLLQWLQWVPLFDFWAPRTMFDFDA
jgi:hypothetical protein